MSPHLSFAVTVVFVTMVMVVRELSKLWEERAAIIEGLELVYPNEGIARVKPATLCANASHW
jgi:hypothetical protein